MTEPAPGKSYQFSYLLVFLLIYLFASPFLIGYPSLAIIAHFLLSISLCFAVLAVRKQQNHRSYAMGLLVPVLILYWLSLYDIIPFGKIGAYVLLAVFFMLLVISFTAQLFRIKQISLNEIFATLCLYLIIGLLWGVLYALLYELSPGSYSGTLLEEGRSVHLNTFTYFSLVTLTTLGYGDITPQTPGAAALCQLEAIVGQFYTAVVVAWLVGNLVSNRRIEKHGYINAGLPGSAENPDKVVNEEPQERQPRCR